MTFLCEQVAVTIILLPIPQSVSLCSFVSISLSLDLSSAQPHATQVPYWSSAFPWKKHGSWAQARPRGATPRPRSGAEAGRTSCPKGGGREELPRIRGQGWWPRVPGCDGAGTANRSCSSLRSGAAAGKSCPTPKSRGGSQGRTPHPRPGAEARRSNPTSKEQWLCGHRRA